MNEPSHADFAVVASLLELVADPKAAAKRVAELHQQLDAAAKAQAQLDADREQHDRAVAAAKAELDAREAALSSRTLDVAGREGRNAHESEVIARWKRDHDFVDGDLQPGGTLRRARAS